MECFYAIRRKEDKKYWCRNFNYTTKGFYKNPELDSFRTIVFQNLIRDFEKEFPNVEYELVKISYKRNEKVIDKQKNK